MNRPPRILIHIEDPRRDASALITLAELFRRAGTQPFLSTRRTTELLLKSLPFEAVLVAGPENISYDLIPQIIKRTRIFMLPTEGAIFDEGPLMIKYGGGEDKSKWACHIETTSRFFLWGENSRRVLQKIGLFPDQKLVAAGAPRMDFFLTRPAQKEISAAENRIGIVSSFILINSIVRVPTIHNIEGNRKINWASQSTTRHYEDRVWTEAACFRVLLDLFEECHRRKQPIWVRPHFQESAENWLWFKDRFPGTLYFGGEGLPFESWLSQVRAVAAFNSTTFFEAVAAGKPAVNLAGLVGPRLAEHTDRHPQAHYPILDQVESPENWDQMFGFLDRVSRMQPGEPFEHSAQARSILQDVCNFPRPVSALARVVHTVLSDLGEAPSAAAADRWQEGLALAKAKALEAYTFRLRGDAIGNCWFPLEAGALRRRFRNEIQRYLRSAQTFPWKAVAAAQAQPGLQGAAR